MNKKYIELAERAGFSLWGKESWNPGDVIDWSARYDKELESFADMIVKESWNPGDVIDWSARYDKELESFADMIVRECAEICLEANDHKNILRHFGVEE